MIAVAARTTEAENIRGSVLEHVSNTQPDGETKKFRSLIHHIDNRMRCAGEVRKG